MAAPPVAHFYRPSPLSICAPPNTPPPTHHPQIQKTLVKYQGMLRQFLTDDKGTVAILVWGCPPYAHIDNPARAALAALELQAALSRVRSPPPSLPHPMP